MVEGHEIFRQDSQRDLRSCPRRIFAENGYSATPEGAVRLTDEAIYLGTNDAQAKGLVSNEKEAVLYTVLLKLSEIPKEKILTLTGEDWVYTVMANRRKCRQFDELNIAQVYLDLTNNYDVIIGAIADDKMNTAVDFIWMKSFRKNIWRKQKGVMEIMTVEREREFELSKNDQFTCMTQASLYEYVYREGYDVLAFSDLYISSDFCNREMDSVYSVFQREDPLQILDFVIPQIGELKKMEDSSIYVEAADLGYIYRYLHFLTGLPSVEIGKRVNARSMLAEMHKRMDWNLEDVATEVAAQYLQI